MYNSSILKRRVKGLLDDELPSGHSFVTYYAEDTMFLIEGSIEESIHTFRHICRFLQSSN